MRHFVTNAVIALLLSFIFTSHAYASNLKQKYLIEEVNYVTHYAVNDSNDKYSKQLTEITQKLNSLSQQDPLRQKTELDLIQLIFTYVETLNYVNDDTILNAASACQSYDIRDGIYYIYFKAKTRDESSVDSKTEQTIKDLLTKIHSPAINVVIKTWLFRTKIYTADEILSFMVEIRKYDPVSSAKFFKPISSQILPNPLFALEQELERNIEAAQYILVKKAFYQGRFTDAIHYYKALKKKHLYYLDDDGSGSCDIYIHTINYYSDFDLKPLQEYVVARKSVNPDLYWQIYRRFPKSKIAPLALIAAYTLYKHNGLCIKAAKIYPLLLSVRPNAAICKMDKAYDAILNNHLDIVSKYISKAPSFIESDPGYWILIPELIPAENEYYLKRITNELLLRKSIKKRLGLNTLRRLPNVCISDESVNTCLKIISRCTTKSKRKIMAAILDVESFDDRQVIAALITIDPKDSRIENLLSKRVGHDYERPIRIIELESDLWWIAKWINSGQAYKHPNLVISILEIGMNPDNQIEIVKKNNRLIQKLYPNTRAAYYADYVVASEIAQDRPEEARDILKSLHKKIPKSDPLEKKRLKLLEDLQ